MATKQVKMSPAVAGKQTGGSPKGGTKGGTTNDQLKQLGRNLARVAQQGK